MGLESIVDNSGLNVASALLIPLALVVGAVSLLFGYRLFRLLALLAGFAVGTVAAAQFVEPPLSIVAGLVVGLICLVFWVVGVFVLGGVLGFLAAWFLGIREPLIVAFPVVLLGILAVAVRKLIIVVSTSLYGSGLIVGTVVAGDQSIQLIATLILAIVGIAFQYCWKPGGRKPDNAGECKNAISSTAGAGGE